MYRIVFFKIPFMRGGYRVPACPFGDKPITHMAAYKVAEVVTDLAFAETQREIIVDGATAVAADDGKANYVYIAQTTNSTVGVYKDDVRGAYYWMDDLQFVGVQDGSDTPAAVVTISPDVWLTDFFSSQPIVQGRLAQSTVAIENTPRTALQAPYYDAEFLQQFDALTPGAGLYIVASMTTERGEIETFVAHAVGILDAEEIVRHFGSAAKLETRRDGAAAGSYNVTCVKIYMLPGDFLTSSDGQLLYAPDDGVNGEWHIISAQGYDLTVGKFIEGANIPGKGLVRVRNIKSPSAAASVVLYNINCKSWLVTPARFVEISPRGGIKNPSGSTPTLCAFFIAGARAGDDGIKIYLQVGDEFIDVSDDFIVDFAVNDEAVKNAQHKQLVALQTVAGAIGAIGGAVGGFSSGNYFGGVQSIVGGVENLANLGAVKNKVAQMRGNGDVFSFYSFAHTLALIVSTGIPVNNGEISAVEAEYGWQYDNAPYMDFNAGGMASDAYYRFADVAVSNMTGGQGAQREVANALVSGVRLVDISKL